MTTSGNPLVDLLQLLVKEARRRVLLLSGIFSVTAVLGLGVVLSLPKKFDAYTILLVDASNILKPILEGRAVPTSVADQVAITSQSVQSRRILREVLAYGGWLDPPPDPKEEERLLLRLKAHIKIDSPREELIRIAYSDSDAKRTFKIANKLAEIYMRESTESKQRESREAFDFIDKQTKEYGDKLTEAHQKVLAYYRNAEAAANPPQPEPAPSAPRRPAAPRLSPDQIAELRAEEATLSAQLGKKASGPTGADLKAITEQYRSRTINLQNELDKLLTSYTDEHPDVRRVRREIETARAELHRAEQNQRERERDAAAAATLDEQVARATRLRLEEVQRQLAAATGRAPAPHHSNPVARVAAEAPDRQQDPELRGVVVHDTTLSELLRRYEATKDVYQDLLKRRENARVSMELDAQHKGFTLRVQEPAEMPVTASGLRLLHLCLIALVFASLVPFGVLFAIVKLDSRVRSAQQIERLARVPLLVSISDAAGGQRERSQRRARGLFVALMFAGVAACYVAAFLFELKQTS